MVAGTMVGDPQYAMGQEIEGLSESEVIARRQRGQGNIVQFQAGRSYLQILRKNAFTFINTVLFAIGVVLVLMGQIGDAVVTAGLVLLNVLVGVFQEGRAKRKLEQIALLTVGIPIFAIAAWARPGPAPRSVIRSASHFVFPAAITVAVVALAIYLSYLGTTGDVEIARTALTTTTVLCGLVLIPFVEPPTNVWVGGDVLSGDWRPSALALGMLGLFGVIMAVPALRAFFELTPLPFFDYLLIGIVVAVWAFLLRFIWRKWLFELVLESRVG